MTVVDHGPLDLPRNWVLAVAGAGSSPALPDPEALMVGNIAPMRRTAADAGSSKLIGGRRADTRFFGRIAKLTFSEDRRQVPSGIRAERFRVP